MKVQGTEPVVMAKVVDLTARQDVKDTRRTAIDMSLQSEPQSGPPAEAMPRELQSDEVVDRLNLAMRALSTRLKFQKHEASGKFVVRVIMSRRMKSFARYRPSACSISWCICAAWSACWLTKGPKCPRAFLVPHFLMGN